jgi:transposase
VHLADDRRHRDAGRRRRRRRGPPRGLRRIDIDEINYRRHHRYLLVVVDHDRRRLVYATDGASQRTLEHFFDRLGAQRAGQISHVSADGAPWISRVVAARCPNAMLCADPFHIVKWATMALDEVRREVWNRVRVRRRRARAAVGPGKVLKDAR